MEREELWITVNGFQYEVSNLGRVRRSNSRFEKVLKPWKLRKYLSVTLMRDGKKSAFTVHKLVAEAFLGARPTGAVVHHLDGDGRNNRLENLCYTTNSWNLRSAGMKRFSDETINLVSLLSKQGVTGKSLAAMLGCCESTISNYIRSGAET